MKKRGQMQLSFGMIFSIILIIFFVAIAFYAIKKLLEFQDSAKILNFKNELQNDVDKVGKSSKTPSQEKPYSLPSRIKKVCVVDFSSPVRGDEKIYNESKRYFSDEKNLFLYPFSSYDESSMIIKNIDLEKTTFSENPLCFDVSKSKVQMILQKNFSESLVTIKKIPVKSAH